VFGITGWQGDLLLRNMVLTGERLREKQAFDKQAEGMERDFMAETEVGSTDGDHRLEKLTAT
jgi:hypothetical protein